MGSLSRSTSGWQNYVHIQNHGLGPSGQLANLMHYELKDIAFTQRVGIQAMEAGLGEMAGMLEHLAWVQEQASKAQLTAQYRLFQLQSEALGQLRDSNDTLRLVSMQLTEVSEVLQSIRDSQVEHIKIIKAERTIKEVLFQLGTMLEEMIAPDDQTSQLALCQAALDQLDHYGLGTAALSDLEDKRAFAKFVKSTRQTVRDVSEETQADLLAFETWYKGYKEAAQQHLPTFVPIAPPLWEARQHQDWRPVPGPAWVDRPAPTLTLKKLRRKPKEIADPGEHPLPEQFGEMPGDIFVGSNLVRYPYQTVAPGTFTPDTVPSEAETNQRLPKKGRGVMQFLDSVFCSAAWENAQRFESELRRWADQTRAYRDFCRDMTAWEAETAKVEAENRRLEEVDYPASLALFKEVEAVRRREYEAAVAEHDAHEADRVAEWESMLVAHENTERTRRLEWEHRVREHEASEDVRLKKWRKGIQHYLEVFQAQGRTINLFLEEHPDIQLLYRKVDFEKDSAAMRLRCGFDSDPKSRSSVEPRAWQIRTDSL